MAGNEPVVIKLSDLVDSQEAVCFAALVRKTRGTTKAGQPFMKCYFRDKRTTLEAPLWHDHHYFRDAEGWPEGTAFRLMVRGKYGLRYGMQIEILAIRPATDDDIPDGFDFADLVESSKYAPEEMLDTIRSIIDRQIEEPHLKRLVVTILEDNWALFQKMPAAQNFHHSYNSGLLEHVWSMTRIASFLASHYSKYYDTLNPPINKGIIIAATILHDIGKLRELEYHPIEARYTKDGRLIGHILMGRDMVREAAKTIDDFPVETLLLLEHAILAHHGRLEFGSPVQPLTIEAMIVSHIDDLDAKVNMVVRNRLESQTEDPFTERIFALDNRRFYKGVPEANGTGEHVAPARES
jgi:3'-5' exoribonuclease